MDMAGYESTRGTNSSSLMAGRMRVVKQPSSTFKSSNRKKFAYETNIIHYCHSTQGCGTPQGSSNHTVQARLPWSDIVLGSFLYDHLRGAAAEVSGKVTSLLCPAVTQPLIIQ